MKYHFLNCILLILLLSIVCCNFSINRKTCSITQIKRLLSFSHQGPQSFGYAHSLLVDEFPRECIDSSIFVSAALKYADTVGFDRPVDIIQFYNSDKDFKEGEISQSYDIEKSCLIIIGIDKVKKAPKYFIFYNSDGKLIYEGERWFSVK